MAEQKTRPNAGSVAEFIAKVDDEAKRADAEALMALMEKATGEPPVLWGTMIGFGQYHYKYESGTEGDAFLVGLAPRKADTSIYLMIGDERQAELLARLGKHRMGKACLYVKRLSDIDMDVLGELVALSVSGLRAKYPQ